MASARPPAPQTPPPAPPPPPPQLQPRCPQAAPPARSRRWTATPASAIPTASTSAVPYPAQAAPAQRQQRQQQQLPQLRRPPQRAQCPPDLLQASPVSSPSPMEAPPSQAAQNGFMAGSTKASCGAAPRLTPLART